MAEVARPLNWTAVGLSAAAPPEASFKALVDAHEMVVWRGRDQQIRVWENRCPHRGMRLSYGFVRGDRLTCSYHGWTYDGEGACVMIPANPEIPPPKNTRTRKYACVEHAGMIWAASEPIEVDAPNFSGEWVGCRSIAISRSPDDVNTYLGSGDLSLSLPDETEEVRPVSYSLSLNGNGTYLIQLGESRLFEAVLCAIQWVSDDQTFLHISVLALLLPKDPAGGCGDALKQISDWAKDTRALIESSEILQSAA